MLLGMLHRALSEIDGTIVHCMACLTRVLPLASLLQLIPRLTADLQATVIKPKPILALAPMFFSNPEEGPTVVDTSSSAITVIVKGKEIAETIIDGGSGVNVINRRTCDNLGIREWELCPF